VTRRDTSRAAQQDATTKAHRSRRRPFIVLLIVLIGAVGGGIALRYGRTRAQPKHPRNVLLITMDTTRADYLGCFGSPTAQTPNLDRLARAGAIFSRCTTCVPLTLPSHSSIMTSLYTYVHGARQNGTGRLPDANLTLAEALKTAGFATEATVAAFVLNAQFGIAQGFDVYHDVVAHDITKALNAERKGDEVCDDALKMLQELASRPRFFLWVHFYDPHAPYESKRIPDTSSPLAYADEITFMDEQIGRLLDQLRTLGHENDTLVVAVADHGEGLGQHDEPSHGYFLYDTTLRVPLLLRCPGVIPAGQNISAQVRTIDIAPTILDVLGCPALPDAQGVSLLPLLKGPTRDLKLAAYSEAFDGHVQYGLSALRSLSLGAWRYILAPTPELYDLSDDPGETRSRLADQPERAAEMRAQLRQLIADAPPPRLLTDAAPAMSADDRDRLAALGYVYVPVAFQDNQVELDRFEPTGGDPKDYAHYLRLISSDLPALRERKDWPRCEQLLNQLIAAMPDATRLYVSLATVLQPQGRVDEAAAAFDHALALSPQDPDVHCRYGNFLMQVQRYDDAIRQFEWVRERLPDDAHVLDLCGRAYALVGQLDLAEQRLERARALNPRGVQVLRGLGMVAERRGQLAEAAKQYQAALDIDPNCQECRDDLARVQPQ
jgi:arylsulfatase A-like enzyme/Tfp pilus assembly protein PilF